MNHCKTLAIALICAALAACASTPEAPPPPPAPAALPAGLAEGIALYDKGDYNGAIKRLGASDMGAGASMSTQLAALKYTAFSYCLTNRQTFCRLWFEKALKLDPAFDLAPGEYGHPLWGPVFAKAKKAK